MFQVPGSKLARSWSAVSVCPSLALRVGVGRRSSAPYLHCVLREKAGHNSWRLARIYGNNLAVRSRLPILATYLHLMWLNALESQLVATPVSRP